VLLNLSYFYLNERSGGNLILDFPVLKFESVPATTATGTPVPHATFWSFEPDRDRGFLCAISERCRYLAIIVISEIIPGTRDNYQDVIVRRVAAQPTLTDKFSEQHHCQF
jgi:hypothetical protein